VVNTNIIAGEWDSLGVMQWMQVRLQFYLLIYRC